MIDEIRLKLAVLLFCVGAYLVWDLFATGFDVVVLLTAIACFIFAHYVKPNTRDGSDSSSLWDVLDFVIDISFKVMSVFLRGISRSFKGDADIIDL